MLVFILPCMEQTAIHELVQTKSNNFANGLDPKTETIPGNPEAMKLFKREYRKPYEVPENV